ncbi:uncharacterized protein LOC129774283 [Toxorhynchites rutilus septentrionalis]|uniref:uncharacterized protein LOC129774283 n=1 Tax=Toxorhynchites rutilus septentrionalis TaxID=329112 RepID=UPI00247845F4|nr:uncharacterized protein LOC129774283 [Toxorhynchites rutilus septentrionalis]
MTWPVFKFVKRSESIYDVIYLNRTFSKLFGVAVYSDVGKTEDCRIAMSRWNRLAILTLLLLEGYVFFVSHVILERSTSAVGQSVRYNGTKYVFIMGSFYMSFEAITNYWHCQKLCRILHEMNKFDKRTKEMNAPICHTTQKRRILLATAIIFLFWSIFTVSAIFILSGAYESWHIQLLILFSLIFFNGPLTIMKLNLFIVSYLFYCRLSHLNDFFSVHFVPGKKSTTPFLEELPGPRGQDCKVTTLQNLMILRSDINRVAGMISGTFSKQIIFIAVVTTALVTLSLFTLYRSIVAQEDRIKLRAIVHLQCSMYCVLMAIALIAMFDGIKCQAKKTAVLVHKAIRETENKEIQSQLMQFSMMLNHRTVVISCGWFVCDWTMGMRIIQNITSYLVILIQFDSSLITKIED